jgi:hypothetical protein
MTAVAHAPCFRDTGAVLTVNDAERILSDWFGAEVILTSSGRAAILLYLKALGLNRYRDQVVLPRFISSCVLDAVIRCGFPVDAASGVTGDASILYHQFGIPQRTAPSGAVIEDICHAFFASPTTGGRDWKGDVAVFSVPKFFGLKNMVGGLVLVKGARSAQLREMRDGAPTASKVHRDRGGREVGSARNAEEQEDIETRYLRRLLNPALLDDETGGLPGSTGEIRAIGHARQDKLCRLVEAAGRTSLPPGWVELLTSCLPFALPVFLGEEMLRRANARLSEIGVVAGEYQIDVARDMSSPRHERAVLVPCHHEIPAMKLDEMAGILRSVN